MDMDLKYPSEREIRTMLTLDLQFMSEYSENNHRRMEHIFNNYDNEAEVRRMGEAINNFGEFEALQANFYILCKVLKHLLHKNPERETELRPKFIDMRDKVKLYWDGVGEWRN